MLFFYLELEDQDDGENVNVEAKHEQSEKDKYLEESQHNYDSVLDLSKKGNNSQPKEKGERVKRQSDYEYTPTKTRCPLLLVADYRFFQEMGASNTKTTISYLVSIMFVLELMATD